MSDDTTKCPRCGKKVSWSSHGYTCLKCGAWAFNPAKSSDMAELSYPALLHRIREFEADNAILSGGVDALEKLKDGYMDDLAEARKIIKELVVCLASTLHQASGDDCGNVEDAGLSAYEDACAMLVRARIADETPEGCRIVWERLEGWEPILGQAREVLNKTWSPSNIVISDPVKPWKCGCMKTDCRHCFGNL